ncbi:hypothetical protein FXO38_08618 [Capsicum annuum]|nr:hypothetical protein FXO38_08618 [Capsicum annuum]
MSFPVMGGLVASIGLAGFDVSDKFSTEGGECGLYMMTYAECLTFDKCVPNVDFDSDLRCMIYASILWHYGSRKEEEKTQSDDEAPMRPPMKIRITKDTEVHDI